VDPDPKTEWSDKSTMNKIMEYMFFGCPIVAFDLKEHRFSAKDGAIYAAPNCEQDMANKIEQLLSDEHWRRQMSAYNRMRVESLLLWDHSIPHLLNAYEHLFRTSVWESLH